MGSAKYACSGGCSCPAGRIDAVKAGEQLTGADHEYHLVNVTQARDCVVTLQNEQEGKKFKLLELMLSTSSSYQQMAGEHREQWRKTRRGSREGGGGRVSSSREL